MRVMVGGSGDVECVSPTVGLSKGSVRVLGRRAESDPTVRKRKKSYSSLRTSYIAAPCEGKFVS